MECGKRYDIKVTHYEATGVWKWILPLQQRPSAAL